MWCVTSDTWHVTHGRGWSSLSKFKLPSCCGFGLMMFWRLGGKGSLIKSNNLWKCWNLFCSASIFLVLKDLRVNVIISFVAPPPSNSKSVLLKCRLLYSDEIFQRFIFLWLTSLFLHRLLNLNLTVLHRQAGKVILNIMVNNNPFLLNICSTKGKLQTEK